MAGRLNLHGSVVTSDAVTYPAETQIVVRNNTATLSDGHGILAEKPGVVAVAQPAPRDWTVTFDDGVVWRVHKARKKGG